MIRYFIVFLWVLGVLAGCSLNPSTWESGDDPEGDTDLGIHLLKSDPSQVGNVDLNGDEADHTEAPQFTQTLANTVRPVHSRKQTLANQLDDKDSSLEPVDGKPSGKRLARRTPSSADLVGGELMGDRSRSESANQDRDGNVEVIADFNPKMLLLVVKDLSDSNLETFEEMDPQEIRGFASTLFGGVSAQVMFLSADVFKEGSRLLNLVLNGEAVQNRNVLTMDTQDYEDIFVETMTHKTRCRGCGKRKERPLGAVHDFLQSDSADMYLKDVSDLAVLIIANNDENRFNRKGEMITSEHILDVMSSRYPDKNIRGYSLTVLDDECRKSVRYRNVFAKEGKYAPVITEFADRTQGGSFSLCTPSFSEVAEEIVLDHQNQS